MINSKSNERISVFISILSFLLICIIMCILGYTIVVDSKKCHTMYSNSVYLIDNCLSQITK